MTTPKFYVYTYAYPPQMYEGAVFYVGKGSGNRVDMHEKEARSFRPLHPQTGLPDRRLRWGAINAVWMAGYDVVKRRVMETDSEDEAYLEEYRLIQLHDTEHLTNTLDVHHAKIGRTRIGPYDAVADALWWLVTIGKMDASAIGRELGTSPDVVTEWLGGKKVWYGEARRQIYNLRRKQAVVSQSSVCPSSVRAIIPYRFFWSPGSYTLSRIQRLIEVESDTAIRWSFGRRPKSTPSSSGVEDS